MTVQRSSPGVGLNVVGDDEGEQWSRVRALGLLVLLFILFKFQISLDVAILVIERRKKYKKAKGSEL